MIVIIVVINFTAAAADGDNDYKLPSRFVEKSLFLFLLLPKKGQPHTYWFSASLCVGE